MPNGTVYDLDFTQGNGRVDVLQNAPPPNDCWTAEPRVLSILRAAYAQRLVVDTQVDAQREVIQVFVQNTPAPLPPQYEYRVDTVRYDRVAGDYTAEFTDHVGNLMVGTDPTGLAQTIVDGGVATGEFVGYLDVDAVTGEIVRVKLNH